MFILGLTGNKTYLLILSVIYLSECVSHHCLKNSMPFLMLALKTVYPLLAGGI